MNITQQGGFVNRNCRAEILFLQIFSDGTSRPQSARSGGGDSPSEPNQTEHSQTAQLSPPACKQNIRSLHKWGYGGEAPVKGDSPPEPNQTEPPQTARPLANRTSAVRPTGGTGAKPLLRATARKSHPKLNPTRHRSNRRMDCEARSGFATSTVQECTPVLDCTGAGARREIAHKTTPQVRSKQRK